MSKGMYVGVDGTAHKVKKAYVGVDGVARKVKKGYIGVNGVARLFFSAGELKQYGLLSAILPYSVIGLAGASIGGKAIFAGGTTDSINSSTTYYQKYVMSVNESLTTTNLSNMSSARILQRTASTDQYACFVGGRIASGIYNNCDAYNASLTRTSVTLPATSSYDHFVCATQNRLYVSIAHENGSNTYASWMFKDVYMADNSFTWTKLPNPRTRDYSNYDGCYMSPVFGRVANYAAVIGGITTDGDGGYYPFKWVDYYDESGTLRNGNDLTYGGVPLCTSFEQERALLFGCRTDSGAIGLQYNKTTQIINKSLTVSTLSDLPHDMYNGVLTAHVNGVTLAAGGDGSVSYDNGITSSTYVTAVTYLCDNTGTITQAPDMKYPRTQHAAAVAGNYMVFAGGSQNYVDPDWHTTVSVRTAKIEAYSYS